MRSERKRAIVVGRGILLQYDGPQRQTRSPYSEMKLNIANRHITAINQICFYFRKKSLVEITITTLAAATHTESYA